MGSLPGELVEDREGGAQIEGVELDDALVREQVHVLVHLPHVSRDGQDVCAVDMNVVVTPRPRTRRRAGFFFIVTLAVRRQPRLRCRP